MARTRYFLGVDGGQSSTTAYIGDERGRFLGGGVGEPANNAVALRRALRTACKVAGLDVGSIKFAAACLGFSGGPQRKRAMVEREVRAVQVVVTDDAQIALAGATGGEPGIITIAGTGSISYGRNASGRRARAGGWGYLLGDEGGALDIARQAVRAALRYEEGWGPETRLLEAFLAMAGLRTANDLMHRFYQRGYPRSRIAELAILVDRVAQEGDPVAREILHNAAQQLATYTGAVRHQLFEPGEPAVIAYVGGVYQSRMLLERFRMLVELEDGNRVIAPRHAPAGGALLEAYRSAGVRPASLPDSLPQ